ncbi:MAG TPA: helix-turn-helix domain-containing protein [Candidatus Onthousia faecipullorum]|uniref:Helix-turn-helix domain-containing protein n=1 Tax=Candidatus Onthousia faecipullorum TaxID=2840887 RepID=A0A9D1KBF8_9FIRM|nr:helix-turn-helix domain-containing protein [Candidatus Onthousia faecipullorum]
MKELGYYLEDTRRSNGVSLEEAASDLNVDVSYLENIESANVRAFKDVYYMRKLVKEYAKYLGLSPEKIQDEFNDFLFEHTSKISLDDIMEAKKKKEEEEKTKKIQSPYTKEYKRKIKKLPFVLAGIIFLLAIIISIVVIKTINREPAITSELKGIEVYEYTY